MSILSKLPTEITLTDLDDLVAYPILEQKVIEYKRDLPGGSEQEKAGFLHEASSFANSTGGYLIYGLEAPKGKPLAAPGIQVNSIDEAKQRLDNLLQTGLQPRIRYELQTIESTGDPRIFFVLWIPRSWNGPHRVSTTNRFYGRNSNGKYPLDVFELRDAFLATSSFEARAREFRSQRLELIRKGETPSTVKGGMKLVIHGLPLSAFSEQVHYPVLDLSKVGKGYPRLAPGHMTMCNPRSNFEGFLGSDQGSIYLQWFRNGAFEYVDSKLLSLPDEVTQFNPWEYEGFLPDYLKTCFQVAKQLRITPPFLVGISLLGVRSGTIVRRDPRDHVGYSKRREFVLPEVVFNSFDQSVGLTLKPVLDMIWNEYDVEQSDYIQGDGTLIPPIRRW